MHCAYCGVDYSFENPCRCLPPVREADVANAPRVDVPWGEAAVDWSLGSAPETARMLPGLA